MQAADDKGCIGLGSVGGNQPPAWGLPRPALLPEFL